MRKRIEQDHSEILLPINVYKNLITNCQIYNRPLRSCTTYKTLFL